MDVLYFLTSINLNDDCSEEITYLMMCTDVNNDGKVDYMEFTERFHNPARDIGLLFITVYVSGGFLPNFYGI